MNKNVIFWSITVGLGGLLFGMDTAVISGAEKTIQNLWNLDNLTHGLAVAIALYGTVIGAAIGGIPADTFGRKPTLMVIGISFFLSAIGTAIASNVEMFMLFRFLGGLGIGASSVVAPVYISEIAPAKHRGKLVISFQLNIVFGILLAYISNYLIQGLENDWRWMLAVVALPSLLFSVLIYFTPETPYFLLLKRNNQKEAERVLQLADDSNPKESIERIMSSVKNQTNQIKEALFSSKYTKPIFLAFLIAFFNQMSGINAVIYFAPRIYELTGLATKGAFLATAGIGIANLIFTMLGWYLIDRFGRKKLMLIGSIGYLFSLGHIAYSFHTQNYQYVPHLIFMFIGAHAIGQGSVIWVFISEIFPSSVRAKGMTLGSLTHWVFAALIANFFPFFTEIFGGETIFGFFTFMMLLQLVFVIFMMPETKGSSLEDLEKQIVGH
ncbi:MAG: hypothetical protein RIR51_1416 [Bacteroidota bacterium]|jgi:sugar porter (SP) family MFS transporter